jgi:xanthine/CO dehydrogenase XdhC/CoxF family maturation factor
MREIIDALERATAADEELVLATVVGSSGSVYRREGAKTLLSPDGRAIGTISGGCLDTDLRERARTVLADRRPRLVAYDTLAMNDEIFGLGLGCGGEVEVWIEPLDWWRSDVGRTALARIRDSFVRGEAPVVVTVLRRDGIAVDSIERWLADEPLERPRRRTIEGGIDAFFDRLVPPRRMIVVGSGADAEPLVFLAASVGFEVTLVSDRGGAGLAERFPDARHRVGEVTALDELSLHGSPAVVLVTHRSATDRDVLRALIPRASQISYLGLLGPRARSRSLFEELAAEGLAVDDALRAKLHGPAGLDLGSESPAEIALSIVAEALAASNHRSARPLREKSGSRQ